MSTDSCKLCRFTSSTAGEPIEVPKDEIQPVAIVEDAHWIVALNENQATLGRVYLVLKRHETDVSRLSLAELLAMWDQMAKVQRALHKLFAPDHFNHMFLMNVVPHVHFHIYPRYAASREFYGATFLDPQYGGHYDPAKDRRLDATCREALVTALRKALGAA